MKLITRDTDYALRALGFIAGQEQKIVAIPALTRALKIPRSFLRKILQKLSKNKLIKSYKGQGGGFSLAMPPEKIFLLDLIEVFQGSFKLNECFFKKNICPKTRNCLLKKKIDKIEEYVARELRAVSIAHLLR